MSKRLYRPPPSDDESSSSDEEEQNYSYTVRGGAGGGKQLRLSIQNSDESGSEPEAPARVMHHGGGKMLRYHPPQNEDSSSSSSSSEEEEEEEEEAPAPVQRSSSGGEGGMRYGGKMLRPMQTEDDESSSSSEEEEEEEEEPAKEEEEFVDEDENEGYEDEEEEEDDNLEDIDLDNFDQSILVKDKADQEYLDSLNEMEREKILADRFEEKKREIALRKALNESKRQNAAKAAPGKKRGRKPQASTTKSNAPAIKKAAASLNRSTRNRDADGNKAKKAGALAKLRQQKEAQQKKTADSDSETDYGSEEDSDEEYVAEGTGKNRWGAASKKTAKANVSSSDEEDDQHTKNYEEAGLEDFRKVTISRHRLSIWCNEPFFENVVVGAYVRISIGIDARTQKNCYRLCKIEGVEVRNSEYKFPSKDKKKQIATNKYLLLSFGKSKRSFRMILVSDGKIEQGDVDRYINQVKMDEGRGTKVLSKREAAKMRKHMRAISENYQYTKEDIDKLVEEKKKRKGVTNIGLAKTKIEADINAARAIVNECTVKLDKAIKESENDGMLDVDEESDIVRAARNALQKAEEKLQTRLNEKEKIVIAEKRRRVAISKSSKAQNWEKVNELAKQENRAADFESYKQRQMEAAAKAKNPEFDPYARRRVKPQLLWEVGGRDDDEKKEEPEAQGGQPAKEEANDSTAVNKNKELEVKKPLFQNISRRTNVDFAIDEEAWVNRISSSMTGDADSDVYVFKNQIRKGISLAEYQERKTSGKL